MNREPTLTLIMTPAPLLHRPSLPLRLRPGKRGFRSVIVGLLVLSASTMAAATAAPASIRPAMEKAAAAVSAGGFVLAEIQGTQVSFAAAGNASPRPGLAPERIVFEIGSVSKVITALLLAQAVQEGRVTLADSLRNVLPPEVRLSDAAAAITLEQLATHTSGLPRLPDNLAPADPSDPYADYTQARLYDFLARYTAAQPAPQPASYSNLGYGLLGHVLERIYGQSYAELVAARIAGPLGLSDTGIALNEDQQARFATPHSGKLAVKPWSMGGLPGAGALRSTAADLARLAQELLSNRDTPLTRAWALIRQPRVPFGDHITQIGLGVLIAKRDGQAIYHHSGGTGGFRSYFELAPDAGTATVLLLNNDSPEPAAVVAAARQPAPSDPPARRVRAETPLDPARAGDYPGVYAIDSRGRFTVVTGADGRLQARLTAQPFFPLFHSGDDRFFLRVVEAEYQFNRDAGGRITSLTLHQNGREIAASRLPDPVPVIHWPSAEELAGYVGRYQLAPSLVFDVVVRAGHLSVKLTGQQALPVFGVRPDHFAYDVVPASLTFERDPASKNVVALVLHQNGRDQRAVRLPEEPAAKPAAP